MTVLFYTTANKEYEHFVPLYIYFALRSNPDSYVEIGIEDVASYKEENKSQIEVLDNLFGDQYTLTTVNFDGVLPGAVRFITEPTLVDHADYVYIGDIDILLIDDDIESQHLENMRKHDAPFSNEIRPPDKTENLHYRLTGLHFAPTDIQYPLPNLDSVDYTTDTNIRGADEHALYTIMSLKGKMISRNMSFRPEHGIHMRTDAHPFGTKHSGKPKYSYEEISEGNQSYAWNGLEVSYYREQILQEFNNNDFQKLFFTLDIEAKNLLVTLENACRDRFDEFEQEAQTYIMAKSRQKRLIDKALSSFRETGVVDTTVNKIIPYLGRVAKRSRLCRWYSQLRGHS